MSKKDIVREHIRGMKDKEWFVVASLAEVLRVEPKDIHNANVEYLRVGILEKEVGNKGLPNRYIKMGNTEAAVELKTKIDSPPPKPAHIAALATAKVRRKVRSPLVRAIDDEIKALEGKIKDLRRVRRDYE